MRCQVAVHSAAMAMGLRHLDTYEVELSVPYAPLGNDLLRELAYSLNGSLEHHRLDTLIMVEMGMHARNRQIMVRMLDNRQALG